MLTGIRCQLRLHVISVVHKKTLVILPEVQVAGYILTHTPMTQQLEWANYAVQA